MKRTKPHAGAGQKGEGILYIVATPIGNLEDISPRARRILSEVDLVASEDTRSVGIFLSRLGIKARQISLFEGNETRRTQEILEHLRQGEDVAVVSEAGTPTVSDPGYLLVHGAVEEGIAVVPVPGPCAAIAALSASGLPTDRHYFEGFLPRTANKIRERLAAIKGLTATLIFYESARRLATTLLLMAEVLGPKRRVVVARELTKIHEELLRGTLEELCERLAQAPVKGEVTVLVSGAEAEALTEKELAKAAEGLLCMGHSPGQAARLLAAEHGCSRREAYQLCLRLAADETSQESDERPEHQGR